MIARRSVLAAGALALVASAAPAASGAAQSYPSKPIQLYVAFAPGGAGDIVARLVARKMAERMGQPFVIENRPSPVVAALTVAKAKPDGHSVVMAGSGTALTSALFKRLPYDLMGDFRHVSTLASFDLALVSNEKTGFKSVGDLVAYARANPGKLNIGTVRVGSTQNLTAEMFKSMANIDVTIVPFKTTAEVVTAVRANEVQAAIEILPPILAQITGNNVKALAVTSSRRFAGLPQVPTVAESGIAGFEASSWNGLSVPARTPPEVIDCLAREVTLAIASPELQKELQALGMVGESSTPEQMTRRMKNDIAKWRGVIEKAGIPLQ